MAVSQASTFAAGPVGISRAGGAAIAVTSEAGGGSGAPTSTAAAASATR